MTTRRSLGILAIALVVCAAALWAGGALTRPELAGWYRDLAKPGFTPPDLAFAVVWPTLFALMALAWWRGAVAAGGLWTRRGKPLTLAFLAQLALNVGWSALFFHLHAVDVAFIDVVLLALVLGVCVRRFWRMSRLAGALLLPYLAWVGFAVVLNLRIWQLN